MKTQRLTRQLISASCLSLLVAWQAFAAEPIQQPNSLETDLEAATAIATQDTAVTPAGCCDGGCDSGCKKRGCSNGNCCCEAVCCPKKVTEEVKKHCWKVESKMVCIPGYSFECNWRKNSCCKGSCGCDDTCCSNGSCNDCGTPTCGRVRCINVLEKHEYTCEECGYEWDVKRVRKGNSRCKSGCCDCPSCGAGGCCASTDTPESDVLLTSGSEALPVEATETKKPSLTSKLMGLLK